MSGSIVGWTLREGKLDDWRSFVTELMGPRRGEWAQSKRRRGITHVTISTMWHDGLPLAVLYVESDDAEASMAKLQGSDDPFDGWLLARQEEIFSGRVDVEMLGDTAPKPGPWMGQPRRSGWWRRWRGR